jgi:hypothetical protein
MITIQSFGPEQDTLFADRVTIIAKLVMYFIAGIESALVVIKILPL